MASLADSVAIRLESTIAGCGRRVLPLSSIVPRPVDLRPLPAACRRKAAERRPYDPEGRAGDGGVHRSVALFVLFDAFVREHGHQLPRRRAPTRQRTQPVLDRR